MKKTVKQRDLELFKINISKSGRIRLWEHSILKRVRQRVGNTVSYIRVFTTQQVEDTHPCSLGETVRKKSNSGSPLKC